VAVIATGARPGESGGQRELFTEETSTVLVFENGGVLRLSAAVAAGQLLFLTNKVTKREVVAQVTVKRDFRPTICYVEVEFSEPSPGFWGIEFPEMPELAPANAQQKEAAELVRAAKAITGESSAPAPAPSALDVMALKQEVEALREQLKLLQTQTGAGKSPAPAMAPDPPGAPVQTDAPREQVPKLPSAASAVPSNIAVTAPTSSGALPVKRAEIPVSKEELLPKPVIKVNRAKLPANRLRKPQGTRGVSTRRGVLRVGLLSAALLFAATGAAWYLHWSPWLPQPKRISASAPSGIAAHPGPTVGSTPQNTAEANSDSGRATQASDTARPQSNAASQDAAHPAPVGEAVPSTVAATGDPAADMAAVRETSAVAAATLAKRAAPRPVSKAAVVQVARPSEEAAIVPPKLIKSVRAIAAPDALRDFATGNVTLDAVVAPSGRVKSIKVLSGPDSLRRAAIDALKQYRYEPATQRGKPVAARITVTIKFLFEP
jgi:protein TonB